VELLVKVILGRSGRWDFNDPVGRTQTAIVIQFAQLTNNADVGLYNDVNLFGFFLVLNRQANVEGSKI